MRSEKPCNNSLCDVFSTCNEGKGVGDYRRTCHRYQRYLGQQEGQSERDALRAEVEVLRRALDATVQALKIADAHLEWGDCTLENVHNIVRQAISEVRKGE